MSEANEELSGEETPQDSKPDWGELSNVFEPHDEDDDFLEAVEDEAPVLGDETPSEEEPSQTPEEPAAAEAPPEVIQETPVEPPAEPTPQPVTPEPEAPPQPQVAETPQPQQPPQGQEPPRTSPEQIAQAREQWVDSIAQTYKLSDEEATSLVTDPNSVLPKLAANLQATVLEQSMSMARQMVNNMLPSYVENVITQREASNEGQDTFYNAWPELKQHGDRVRGIAEMYRQINPQCTQEQFVKDVGVQSWMALGMDAGELAQKINAQQVPATPQPPAPAAPAAPVGNQPAPAAPAGPPVPAPTNPFGGLADQWSMEDL